MGSEDTWGGAVVAIGAGDAGKAVGVNSAGSGVDDGAGVFNAGVVTAPVRGVAAGVSGVAAGGGGVAAQPSRYSIVR